MTVDNISLLKDSMKKQDMLQQPWTCGVHKLSDAEQYLFYKNREGSFRRMKLSTCTVHSHVEELANACLPATFGKNKVDVLDETYRKAGKIDYGDFSWLFNPESNSHLVSKLVSGLFPFGGLDYGIRFEPYKLNVYGKGSFFKSHVDTPRGEDMFGSLVVILPVGNHKGGELLLRHKSKELRFDASALLAQANPKSVSVAYVAFFSDIEHEVLKVTKGHRVSVTYNLYYDDRKGIPKPLAPTEIEVEHPFETALKTCLADPTFKTTHKRLGFGLQHLYPKAGASIIHECEEDWDEEQEGLDESFSFLKGVDATIARVLTKYGLDVSLKYVYSPPDLDGYNDRLHIVSSSTFYIDDTEPTEDPDFILCLNSCDEKECIVWKKGYGPKDTDADDDGLAEYGIGVGEYRDRALQLTWVVDPKMSKIGGENTYIFYGNDATTAHLYYRICLVVDLV